MDISQKRKELQQLENQAIKEAHDHAIEKVRVCLPDMKIEYIDVDTNPFDFMGSNLQGGAFKSKLFTITFADGAQVSANMSRSDPDRRQALYLRFAASDTKPLLIEKPMAFGSGLFHKDKKTRYWEKQATWLGINDDHSFEDVVIRLQRWWADLEAALTIYMGYMLQCPVEHARPRHVEYFCHLFSKVHDCDY